MEKAPIVHKTGPDVLIPKWAGFEDIWSIDFKVKYLISAGLGGATLFSIDKDDYINSVCDQEVSFLLLRVINHHLNKKLNVPFPEVFRKTEAAEFSPPDKRAFMEYQFKRLTSFKNKSELQK